MHAAVAPERELDVDVEWVVPESPPSAFLTKTTISRSRSNRARAHTAATASRRVISETSTPPTVVPGRIRPAFACS
jgi:hypothetical protein